LTFLLPSACYLGDRTYTDRSDCGEHEENLCDHDRCDYVRATRNLLEIFVGEFVEVSRCRWNGEVQRIRILFVNKYLKPLCQFRPEVRFKGDFGIGHHLLFELRILPCLSYKLRLQIMPCELRWSC
jgi:hypothetical protein